MIGIGGCGINKTDTCGIEVFLVFPGRPGVDSFCLGGTVMMKFWKNPAGLSPAPTYLPTYLPYLWETKKEITGWVKVG